MYKTFLKERNMLGDRLKNVGHRRIGSYDQFT